MPETNIGPKNLYDLAKALGRWDNEGGATGSSPEADLDKIWHSMQLKNVCCGISVAR